MPQHIRREQIGVLEAAGAGAGEGVSMGFAAEIQGALRAFQEAIASGNFGDIERRYTTLRDLEERKLQQAEQDQPLAYGVSEFAGSMAAPGGVMAKTANTMGNVIKVGAVTEGIRGLGKSEADLTQGEFGQAAVDVGEGALAGGIGGAVGKKVIDTVGNMGQALKNKYADDVSRVLQDTDRNGYPTAGDITEDLGREFRLQKSGIAAKEVGDPTQGADIELQRLKAARGEAVMERDVAKIEGWGRSVEGLEANKAVTAARDEYTKAVDNWSYAVSREGGADTNKYIAVAENKMNAATTRLNDAKRGADELFEKSTDPSKIGYKISAGMVEDLDSEITAMRVLKNQGISPAPSKRGSSKTTFTLPELKTTLLERKVQLVKNAKGAGSLPPRVALDAINKRLSGLEKMERGGYVDMDAEVFSLIKKTTSKDLDFISNPNKEIRDGLLSEDQSLLNIFFPSVKRGAKGVVSSKKALPAAMRASNKILKKYGPVKLQQMGFYAAHLRNQGKIQNPTKVEKYAKAITAGTQAFGIAGAGMVHAKLLETDPQYRQWIRDRLEEENIPMTLLFNKKK